MSCFSRNRAAALALAGVLAGTARVARLTTALSLAVVGTLAGVLGRRGATALGLALVHALAGIRVGLAAALALAGVQTFAGVLVGIVGVHLARLHRRTGDHAGHRQAQHLLAKFTARAARILALHVQNLPVPEYTRQGFPYGIATIPPRETVRRPNGRNVRLNNVRTAFADSHIPNFFAGPAPVRDATTQFSPRRFESPGEPQTP